MPNKISENYFEAYFKNLDDISKKGYENAAKNYRFFYKDFLSKD